MVAASGGMDFAPERLGGSVLICPMCHTESEGLCRHCTGFLRRRLETLVEIFDHLNELLITAPPMDHNERRQARQDPPAPCRLEVLDLTDPRSDTPAAAIVDSWTQMLVEERQLSGVPATSVGQAQLLLLHIEWWAKHPAVDEFIKEVSDVASWLRGVAGLKPPPPLFRCPVVTEDGECEGAVYPQKYTLGVRCRRCGETWGVENDQLARLGLLVK